MTSREIIAARGSKPKTAFAKELGDEADSGNPLVHLMYEFLTVPGSSKVAHIWALLTCWMVVVRVLAIGFESCDGPNQYANRTLDRARFQFLLNEQQYWMVYIACMVPLIIDSFGRLVTLCFVVFGDENVDLYDILKQDKLEIFLFTSDILGVVPFFIHAVYLHPKGIVLDQGPQLVMTMIELMITGRILRVIKDIPAIRAIRIALSHSAQHLIVPLFFFFLFNITAGVFLYFAEPCYDTNYCPWHDLFQSTYYSIVTMTTTGYGNQVPTYELGRFIACCVMIFGALFLSMPLAIIGNEYDKAWCDITEESLIKAELRRREEEEIREALLKRKMPLSAGGGGSGGEDDDEESGVDGAAAAKEVSDPVRELIKREEQERLRQENDRQLALQSAVMTTHLSLTITVRKLKLECKNLTRINPTVLLHYCDLRAWLPVLSHHINSIFETLVNEKNLRPARPEQGHGLGFMNGSNQAAAASGAPRRLSVFGGGARKTLVAPAPPPVVLLPSQQVALSSSHNASSPAKNSKGGLNAISEQNRNSADDEDDSSDDDNSSHNKGSRKGSHSFGRLPAHSGNRKASDSSARSSSEDEQTKYKKGNEVRDSDLPRHLRKQQSILFKVLKPPSSRTSVYARVLKAIGVEDIESIRRRSVSEDFLSRMEKISSNPTTLRSRIWILLELPNSSKEAKIVQIIIIFLIAISIFLLYTQTITKLTLYGHTTPICGKLLRIYCEDKYNATLDPGCFVQSLNGTLAHVPLEYNCEHDRCFGHGYNFGSAATNLTCQYYSNTVPLLVLPNGDVWHTPFQDKEQLIYKYKSPDLFTTRQKMHHLQPVCTRVECSDNAGTFVDGNILWIAAEFTINILFSIELVLRVVVAENVLTFFRDKMNILDILAVIPFYIELLNTVANGPFSNLDFSILASSPEPIFIVTMRSLKVFRMFKLTRHFEASKVLTETATKVFRQILGMLALLAFFVVLFAIFLFQVEGGNACYVGDPGCFPPDSIVRTVHIGDRILVNKEKEVSQFGNVFFGIWFSFVTITTTGYGDVVPVTNIGQVMAIFLMISGTFYMAMPLTAAASTFYQVHEKYQIKHNSPEVMPEELIEQKKELLSTAARPPAAVLATLPGGNNNAVNNLALEDLVDARLRLSVKALLAELLMSSSAINETLKEMQEPVPPPQAENNGGGVNGGGGGGGGGAHSIAQHAQRKHSTLLKAVTRQVASLDRCLGDCERDLLSLVVLHNNYMRNVLDNHNTVLQGALLTGSGSGGANAMVVSGGGDGGGGSVNRKKSSDRKKSTESNQSGGDSSDGGGGGGGGGFLSSGGSKRNLDQQYRQPYLV